MTTDFFLEFSTQVEASMLFQMTASHFNFDQAFVFAIKRQRRYITNWSFDVASNDGFVKISFYLDFDHAFVFVTLISLISKAWSKSKCEAVIWKSIEATICVCSICRHKLLWKIWIESIPSWFSLQPSRLIALVAGLSLLNVCSWYVF